jgi:hypothetical protein
MRQGRNHKQARVTPYDRSDHRLPDLLGAAMNLAASIDFQALMEPVARHFFGDPNIALSKQGKDLRWGARGSLSVNCEKGTWFNHETNAGGGVLDMIRSETGRDHANCIAWLRQQKFILNCVSHGDSQVAVARPKPRIVCTYEYTDEFGALLYEVVRFEPKDFRQRRPDGLGGWIWNLDDTRRVLYRLPELIESRLRPSDLHRRRGKGR